jgi:hypothetical protein
MIKITPADSAFSKCVRASADYKCERCGAVHDKSSSGLHCSHHFRRGNWGIRFDPDNAEALCYGCHSYTGGTEERMREVMTDAQIEILREKKEDTGLGKLARKTKGKGDIAKHYREQLKMIEEKRDSGVQGKIEFDGYF